MSNHLGLYLRQLRQKRRMSVTQLAAAAHLGRKTLTRWEGGQYLPRLAELNSLLLALDASAEIRRRVLELLEAPRALQVVRSLPLGEAGSFSPPRSGDLLRALRQRRGWTQQQLATCLGVAQTTVARWERSEMWPSSPLLHALCAALGAQEEEVAALTAGRFSLGGGPAVASLEEIRERLSLLQAEDSGLLLRDLQFLSLQAAAFPHAQRSEEGRALLADLYLGHASHLFARNRMPELREGAERAEKLLPAGSVNQRISAAIYRAEASIQSLSRFAYGRAAQDLQPWLDAPADPGHQSWLHYVTAWMLNGVDRGAEALEMARRACRIPGLEDHPERFHMARNNFASLCVQCGDPAEALETLQLRENDLPHRRVHGMLVAIRAYLAMNDAATAHTWLTRTREFANTHAVHRYDYSLEELAREF